MFIIFMYGCPMINHHLSGSTSPQVFPMLGQSAAFARISDKTSSAAVRSAFLAYAFIKTSNGW